MTLDWLIKSLISNSRMLLKLTRSCVDPILLQAVHICVRLVRSIGGACVVLVVRVGQLLGRYRIRPY